MTSRAHARRAETAAGTVHALRPRRGRRLRAEAAPEAAPAFYEGAELAYRALCALLYNFAPSSGHPGGSISSGLIALSLAFDGLDYDLRRPLDEANDLLVYAAGHKALGLYALWALRDELARLGEPGLLPDDPRLRLRLEDLLGFRRNPTQRSALLTRLGSRFLDGHPTPAVPFVPVATGASGVGVGAALGLALAARDLYGERAPRVHAIEGEGGLTPGRVHEALAAAATSGVSNLTLHVDWNQASIDSDRVTADGRGPGDYVQWDPGELFLLHDWNVVEVGDGHDAALVLAGQALARELSNSQPTAVIYRTVKGRRYGIEGRASHGAGHDYCSQGFYAALAPFEEAFGARFPRPPATREPAEVEAAFHRALLVVREALAGRPELSEEGALRLSQARRRLGEAGRRRRAWAPNAGRLPALLDPSTPPEPLRLRAGAKTSVRAALGAALGHLNAETGGAFLAAAADLLDSTSVSGVNAAFPRGFYHAAANPGSRLLSTGGICEDAMGAVMAGVAAFGGHVGVTSSYSAFIAPLQHVAARLHAIGQQAREELSAEPRKPWIMVNAHAGPMTGEDGPTHADPQALQLLQEGFPRGHLITLTPWDPREVWPLLAAGLAARPSVLAPFVTRPAFALPDREALRLPPAEAAAEGVYALRRAPGTEATVVVQGCLAGLVFCSRVLPRLDEAGVCVNAFYVASAELFDALPPARREAILPEALQRRAMGITDFSPATLWRWLRGDEGRAATLHPFRGGRFLGSGPWEAVAREGGLDAEAQLAAVSDWARR